MKAAKQDGEEELSDFRDKLERSFVVFDGDSNVPLGPFVANDGLDSNSAVDEDDLSSVGALDRLYDLDPTLQDDDFTYFCEGDLCDPDECLIPESFKISAGKDSVDVMAFLGIQRAEPIIRAKQQDSKDLQ
jgi:hypothetical protein